MARASAVAADVENQGLVGEILVSGHMDGLVVRPKGEKGTGERPGYPARAARGRGQESLRRAEPHRGRPKGRSPL